MPTPLQRDSEPTPKPELSIKPGVNIILEEDKPHHRIDHQPSQSATTVQHPILNTTPTTPGPQPAPMWPVSASPDDCDRCDRCDDPTRHIHPSLPKPNQTKRIAARRRGDGDGDGDGDSLGIDRAEVRSVVWWCGGDLIASSSRTAHGHMQLHMVSGECRCCLGRSAGMALRRSRGGHGGGDSPLFSPSCRRWVSKGCFGGADLLGGAWDDAWESRGCWGERRLMGCCCRDSRERVFSLPGA